MTQAVIPNILKKGDVMTGKRVSYIEKEIERYLINGNKVIVYESLNSTNTALKELAIKGEKEGTVLIALTQTKGKGRLGRSFVSESGGLYMSVLLRPDLPPENSLFITVAAAVAVSKAIEKVCGKKTAIKWVNDIYMNGKKVSGILTEGGVNPTSGRLDYAVLGIGVNIKTPKDGFKAEIREIAGAIFENDVKEDFLPILSAEIVNIFTKYYKRLEEKEYMPFYKENSILKDKKVSFFKDNALHTARVVGIDDNAHLILEQDGRLIELYAGEVSVKIN